MIQIDMPMPTNCLDCPACNEYLTCAIPINGRKWGENDVREFGQSRPEWCPLKEQEAKTGHWIEKEDYNMDTYYDCSVCGESWTTIDGTPWQNGMNYCPHCGAKMAT